MWKGTRRASTGISAAKGRAGKKRVCCWMGTGEAEVLKGIFTSVFTGEICLQESWARKTCPQMWKIRLGNTKTNWTYMSLWGLMGCPHECWGSWPVSLQGHSSLSVERLWWLGKVPKGWKKQKLILFLRKARTASQSHLDGANNPANHFQKHEGQEGDLQWSASIYEGEIRSDQPDGFLQWHDCISGWGENSGCCLSQHWQSLWLSSPLASWQTNRWSADSEVDWQLSKLPGSKGCGQQHEVQTEAVTSGIFWDHQHCSTLSLMA